MESKKTHSKVRSLKRELKRSLEVRGGVQGYRPTPMAVAHWFTKLNTVLFGNRLGRVHIEVSKLQKDWGRCVASWDGRQAPKGKFDQRKLPHHIVEGYFIQLHCKFPTWKDFIETLAHEMVHLYQMTVLKDPYSNHNKNFYAFRPKFESAGLKLYR